MTTIAIIRIRGQVGNHPDRKTALNILKLNKKFSVRLLEDSPSLRGQLLHLAPDITWGEANTATIATLTKKKTSVYHLNPPRKGLGRKGLKLNYALKGAFGYRGDAINDLIMRMT